VIGIGINIAAREGAGLSIPPAWLQELLPGVQAGEILLRVAAPLVQARFNARDALRDRAVVLSDGSIGTAHGTSEGGALLVHTARGMNTVTSSEVSVRPVT
jgi:BirA family biotin operon repressor/biotin-[acetyl-CoA-carboxylase] ligase